MDMLIRHPQRSVPRDYSEETARTVEVIREENEHGELGSFGFTLQYEKPPVVGSIVPGGPADRAGLRKNDIVIQVNGHKVSNYSHAQVVGLIYHTPNAGVWLSVCDPPQRRSFGYGGSFRGQLGGYSMSQSTPVLQRSLMDSPPRQHYTNGDNPPRYDQVNGRGSGRGNQLAHSSMMASVSSISPLKRKVLTQSVHSNRALSNGIYETKTSPPSSHKKGAPSPQSSASVLVLYIGPVEIPDSWSARGLSSKCIQECTRRLLSQRHDFIEVYLELSVSMMKVLNVSRTTLVRCKRDELYYCGICTDDEQYFAIVTQKSCSKSSKLVIDPEVGQTVPSVSSKVRANICHVFKVIQGKSVLVLNSGDKKTTAGSTSKTVSISSCAAITTVIKSLFSGDDVMAIDLSDTSTSVGTSQYNLKVGPSSSSFYSITSSGSNGSSESMPMSSTKKSPQSRRKKLDVFDLRVSSFSSSVGSMQSSSGYSSSPNYYMVDRTPFRGAGLNRDVPNHPMATPAFLTSSTTSGKSWYATSSPKEGHSRQSSWDSRDSVTRPVSGNFERYGGGGGGGGGGGRDQKKKGNSQDRLARKVSDDSSLSSLSSSRTPSPSRLTFRTSMASRSRSPSPARISYSSGSRSRTPSPPRHRSPTPPPVSRPAAPMRFIRTPSSGTFKLSASLALESTSIRNGAISPIGSQFSQRSGRILTLRRQGSESSIMEIQQAQEQLSQVGLPQRNGPLSSSIGSVATLTTIAGDDDTDDPDEMGRVGGWIASFDKLLADALGVQCLLQLLEAEHCEENILFWKEAEEFKKKAPRMQNLQVMAKTLYEQYISPSAPHCINVDDRVQKAVEQNLSNPTPSIFDEAQEQIYQLMKLDCYPRFKKSELVKQCLLAEVEGRTLPIESAPVKKPQAPQWGYNWKKQQKGRSLFSRLGRNRVREIPMKYPLHSSPSFNQPAPERKKKDSKGRKEEAPAGKKEKGKSGESKSKAAQAEDAAQADEFPPENHLNYLQAHKGNIFEINLPNKVTKILEVPKKGTVRDAIRPTLKKHGYPFDIMELRSASTFRSVDMDAPASILIGQHMIVVKSNNTFTAVFPDVQEKILPANGKKTIGEIFSGVMKEMGKPQNYAVYLDGSRVPLELDVDTSALVGQRVAVRYLPGNAPRSSGGSGSGSGSSPIPGASGKTTPSGATPPSKDSPKSGTGPEYKDVDDLISMICRLANDKLDEQRTSPSPRTTPEPGDYNKTSPGMTRNTPPDEQRHLSKKSPSSGSLDAPEQQQRLRESKRRSGTHLEAQMLQYSRSSDVLDRESRHRMRQGERERESRREQLLRAPVSSSSRSRFHRSQSGVAVSNKIKSEHSHKRSHSPPADVSSRNTSPPPPSAKPPPLPPKAKRFTDQRKAVSGSDIAHGGQQRKEEWDGTRAEHLYANRDNKASPQYFPKAHPSLERNHPPLAASTSNPIYANSGQLQQQQQQQYEDRARAASMSYSRHRPGSHTSQSPPTTSPPPAYEYHQRLDNFVKDAYSSAPSSHTSSHQRQSSAPAKQSEVSNSVHPLQNTVRGPVMKTTASGSSLTSYPWYQHSPQPQQPRRHSAQPAHMMPRTARRNLVENSQLMSAGEKLMQKEIEEYRNQSSSDGSSENYRAPLSPTTHMLVVTDDDSTPHHQHETFV